MNPQAVKAYLANLDEAGLKQIATQLILHPESRGYIEQCIKEFEQSYTLINSKKNKRGKK